MNELVNYIEDRVCTRGIPFWQGFIVGFSLACLIAYLSV